MDWFKDYIRVENENKRLRRIVEEKYVSMKELGHAEHFTSLNAKVKDLKQQVTTMREVAEHRNRQLFAAKYIVYCTGCDAGGPANKDTITEEEVRDVEQIAKRLRTWWENMKHKKERRAALEAAEQLELACKSIFGGVGACSQEIYENLLVRVATMCGRAVGEKFIDDKFREDVKNAIRKLPCPLD